jgi:GNAT superfamily N-acetyltransferase
MTRSGSPARHAGQTVIRAGQSDLAVLSQVIAEAFFDQAPSRWLVDDPAVRREIFPAYFQLFVEHALATGLVHTVADRTAVALWIPAGETLPGPPDGYAARLAALTGARAGRFQAFDEALDRHHPAGVPHHHLAILAVRPGRQSHGIGTALLHAHHARLDAEAIPAFLEASGLDSRRLYLRHGYADHGDRIELPDGASMYPMWRDPQDGRHAGGRQ